MNVQKRICIVGLGHVGYSLLKLYTQKYDCIGFVSD